MTYYDLTKKEKEYLCNGVGRRGWQGKVIPEFVFTEAANRHDFDYWQGCTESDRLEADLRFLRNMLLAADYKANGKRRFILFRIFYRRMAIRYYGAVRELGETKTLGGFHFAESKKTHDDLIKEMKEAGAI